MLPEIRDTIILQKREIKSRLEEKYIERTSNMSLDNNLVKVIIGPRRSGKSFYAIHALHKINNFGYINFDDERLTDIKDYNELISAANSVYDKPKYLLLDEIQNLPKWELFVNRLQRQGLHLILTGSNSNLLSKELTTHLTGRHSLITIFPFSFKEYLDLFDKELTTIEIKEKLSQYIINGGFPETLVKNIDLKDYLSTLFNSVVYKDIIKRYNIRNVKEIEDLSYFLISNIASEYSFHSLTKVSRIKSSHTIRKYLHYLEESFIFFSLSRFSYKVKEQISSNKKIYCIDNGFISVKAFNFSPNKGKLYENVVACKLKKDEIDGKINLYYWKNPRHEEVDFVIKRGAKVDQLIQVCYDLEKSDVKNREIRALIKASKELKCDNLLIITQNKEGKEKSEWFKDKAIIQFMPLWKWLINHE